MKIIIIIIIILIQTIKMSLLTKPNSTRTKGSFVSMIIVSTIISRTTLMMKTNTTSRIISRVGSWVTSEMINSTIRIIATTKANLKPHKTTSIESAYFKLELSQAINNQI